MVRKFAWPQSSWVVSGNKLNVVGAIQKYEKKNVTYKVIFFFYIYLFLCKVLMKFNIWRFTTNRLSYFVVIKKSLTI